MKISYNWLKDYCKHDLSVEDLSEKLTNAGLVVDTIDPVDDDFCLEVEVRVVAGSLKGMKLRWRCFGLNSRRKNSNATACRLSKGAC